MAKHQLPTAETILKRKVSQEHTLGYDPYNTVQNFFIREEYDTIFIQWLRQNQQEAA